MIELSFYFNDDIICAKMIFIRSSIQFKTMQQCLELQLAEALKIEHKLESNDDGYSQG